MAAVDIFVPAGGHTNPQHLANYDWSQPAAIFFAVTKSDTDDMPYLVRGLYIGTAGNVIAKDKDGTSVTFKNVPAGAILPIRASRVMATNTTAADIVGLV